MADDWVKQIAATKKVLAEPASLDPSGGIEELELQRRLLAERFPDAWQELIAEFKRVVSAYNSEIGHAQLTIQAAPSGAIGVKKKPYPVGYLDLAPDAETGTFTVRFEVYQSRDDVGRQTIGMGGFRVTGNNLTIVWNGTAYSTAGLVREMMTVFFAQV